MLDINLILAIVGGAIVAWNTYETRRVAPIVEKIGPIVEKIAPHVDSLKVETQTEIPKP